MTNSQPLLDTLLSTTGEAILVFDPSRKLLRASNAFEVASGFNLAGLLDKQAGELAALIDLPALDMMVSEVFSTALARRSVISIPGSGITSELQLEPVLDGGNVTLCLGILKPQANQAGQPNRALFHDRTGQAIINAQRSNKSALVMLVSIDRLREINDVLGNETGHDLMDHIADRLQQCARASDTVVRLEGDRFGFVMQIAAVDDSVQLAEKVMAAFEQPFEIGERQDIAISCSTGVSLFPADASSADELIKNATIALHHAEQGGHGRYQFFSGEMNTRARHRLMVESGIRRALSNNEFLAYYQPKINVETGKVAGLESLIRWKDPQRGMVPPGEFIPVAEESGLIEQIGAWMLEETCAQSVRWQQAGLPPVRASVNVSARQFRNRNFVQSVAEVLTRTGLEPKLLELEITESMLMGDLNTIIARMEDLRRTGVSLSIDDFGTGYSSLSYLSRFPITTLKIDRAFIVDVQSNPHTAEIARAIIGLSRGLNLEVVAEGAEVSEQVEFLRVHGCHVVQGFYYSKPLPADEFAALLKNGFEPRQAVTG